MRYSWKTPWGVERAQKHHSCAENNPYRELDEKAVKTAAFVGEGPIAECEMSLDDARERIDGAYRKIQEAEEKKKALAEELKKKEALLETAKPYRDLHSTFPASCASKR